jgi:putative phosphoesterase
VLIGVVADTHVAEWIPELPAGVATALAGVDLILHAGDITSVGVLERLGEMAPVVAVQGDHDRQAGLDLPRDHLLEVDGHRIGITHGRRWRPLEHLAIAGTLITGRLTLPGLHSALRRRFGEVDCVVHGHLHLPVQRTVDGVLFFCPGAVYVPEADPTFGWDGLRGRLHRRFRDGLASELRGPAVGLIETTPRTLTARSVPLDGPIRPPQPA